MVQTALLLLCILPGLVAISAQADELKPETAAAFDRYIGATEARMDNDMRLNQFLVIDRLPDSLRQEAYNQLHRRQIHIEEMHTEEDHHPFPIPNGQIHHWAGVTFTARLHFQKLLRSSRITITKRPLTVLKFVERN